MPQDNMFNLKDRVFLLGEENEITNRNPGIIIGITHSLDGVTYKVEYMSNSGHKIRLACLTEANLVPEEDVLIIDINTIKSDYNVKYIIIN